MLHLICFKSSDELLFLPIFTYGCSLFVSYYLLECKYSALVDREHFYINRNKILQCFPSFFFFSFFSPKNFKIYKKITEQKNTFPNTVVILLFKSWIIFRFGNSTELLELFCILEQGGREILHCIIDTSHEKVQGSLMSEVDTGFWLSQSMFYVLIC